MPFIDVTDLLTDSFIAGENFTVYRRKENINPFGESIVTVQIEQAVGQISPTSPSNLVRDPAYSSQYKNLDVITTFRLIGAGQDISTQAYQPDLVLWKGNFYIVNKVDDYTHYGAGFVQAICDAFDWTINITDIPNNVGSFTILNGKVNINLKVA